MAPVTPYKVKPGGSRVSHTSLTGRARVRPGLLPGLALLQQQDGVQLVVNEAYEARVRELVVVARTTSAFSDHPSFRLLQILTHLTGNPMS